MSTSSVTAPVKVRPDSSRSRYGPAVDLVVVLVVVATAALWVHDTAGEWFSVDDWLLATQAQHAKGLLEPFNGNMTMIMVAVYRAMYGLWGFSTYLPFRIAGAVSLGAVSLAMYFTTKGRIGRPLAAIAAAILLWPHLLDLTPTALNHWFGLIAGIGCVYLLNLPERRGSNIWLAVILTFSLASAAGGVAFAVGSILFCCCVRPSARRWSAVIAPTALWGIWWLTKARGAGYGTAVHLGTTRKVRYVGSNLWHTLVTFGGGSTVVAGVIGIMIIARAAQVGVRGLDESANAVAWLAATAFWWVGVVWQRGTYSNEAVFRYQFYAIALVLLALMPRRPIVWPTWVRGMDSRARTIAAVAVPVLVIAALVWGNFARTRNSARFLSTFSTPRRSSVMVVNLGSAAVPDATIVDGYLRADLIRDNLAFYGGVPRDTDGRDRAVLESAHESRIATASGVAACDPVTGPFDKGPDTVIEITAPSSPVILQARIARRRWHRLAVVRTRQTVRVRFPALAADVPIELRVEPKSTPVTVRRGDQDSGQVCLS